MVILFLKKRRKQVEKFLSQMCCFNKSSKVSLSRETNLWDSLEFEYLAQIGESQFP